MGRGWYVILLFGVYWKDNWDYVIKPPQGGFYNERMNFSNSISRVE